MSKSRHRRSTFRVPNQLILDRSLTFNARRLGAVLSSRRNPMGFCKKSLTVLAELSGLSVATTRKALSELSNAGYIDCIHTYRYHQQLGRAIYAASVYQCLLPVTKGFTAIPWSIFDTPNMTGSAFVTALYLYYQAGNSTRCFPSLSAISRGIGASLATVCRSRKFLHSTRLFCILQCKKLTRAFSSNSYHILQTATVSASASEQTAVPVIEESPRAFSFPFLLKHITQSKLFQGLFHLWGTLKISKL